MTSTKPTTEKSDYYSRKQQASFQIIEWLKDDKLSDENIELMLLLKFGFGKKLLIKVKELIWEGNNGGKTNNVDNKSESD